MTAGCGSHRGAFVVVLFSLFCFAAVFYAFCVPCVVALVFYVFIHASHQSFVALQATARITYLLMLRLA
jgi:hypothetical protein